MTSSTSLRRRRWLAATAAFVLAAAAGYAATLAIPPAPRSWVTDEAGFLSDSARRGLDARLEAYEKQTGHQVLVWIGRTTGDRPIDDFAVAAFKEWKVGRKGLDDGLAIFVFTEDRKIRFEVGYGLEDRVPDVIAIRIIREVMAPRIQAGDHDGALEAGVQATLSAIEGRPVGPAAAGPVAPESARGPEPAPSRPLSLGQMVVIGILAVGFLLLLVTNPSLAIWLLFTILSGGRGGGGGGGGGGFSGGGGRSGGGGATGSW